MRHELLECFVRIAVAKYVTGSKELDDVSEAVDRLLCVIFDDSPAIPCPASPCILSCPNGNRISPSRPTLVMCTTR